MILFIDACMRHESSRTKALCDHFFHSYTRLHANEEIVRVQVDGKNYPPLENDDILKRDALSKAGEWQMPMFDAAKLFAKADKIVIGAPYWDFSFPAALKCYIEHICVCGITFHYTQTGPEGLCKAEKLLYIATSGGPMINENHGFTYIEGLFSSMLGIPQFECVTAEMLDVEGQDVEGILSKAKLELDRIANEF